MPRELTRTLSFNYSLFTERRDGIFRPARFVLQRGFHAQPEFFADEIHFADEQRE